MTAGGPPAASAPQSAEALGHLAATASAHWAALAQSEINMARWYESQGLPFGDVSSFYHRARTYRLTAESLRREAETGKPHCSICGGAHANHQHPSVAAQSGCKCGLSSCLWCTPNAT